MQEKKYIFINCKQAGYCCDKAQYKEASFTEKFKLVVHLLFCSICRQHTRNNVKLTKFVKKANLKTSSRAEKDMWKQQINNELSK